MNLPVGEGGQGLGEDAALVFGLNARPELEVEATHEPALGALHLCRFTDRVPSDVEGA